MKQKIAVLFGGMSSEYEISLATSTAIIQNIDKNKYDLVLIGITREGDFYLYNGDVVKIAKDEWFDLNCCEKVTISVNRSDKGIINLNTKEIIKIDLMFIALHGRNGEDGTLQGLLELAGIKYVGCDMVSSAICMDKFLAHELVLMNGLLAPKAFVFAKDENYSEILKKANSLKYPLFVKPLKAGSSLGISKVLSEQDLKNALDEAFKFDNKITLEENIDGFEVGCAILGNKDLIIGEVDEIELEAGFFDFNKKYNSNISRIHLPARILKEERLKIKETALKIYKILGCSGLARVDMFYTPDKKIVFNEVNTMPGCTIHSRYPKMLEAIGISFKEVIEQLIVLGLEK